MKRVIKSHQLRRNEILDTAQDFFSEKGYGATSISDIIQSAGIAKGTFYHYFKSKEDLLDQLVQRFTINIEDKLNGIIHNKSLSAIEKFNNYFAEVSNLKLENKSLIKMLIQTLYKDENILLRQKIFNSGMEIAIPKLQLVLKQGSEEGCFNIDHQHETSQHIVSLISSVNESSARVLLKENYSEDVIELLENKFSALETSLERILGAPVNSIHFDRRNILTQFLGN